MRVVSPNLDAEELAFAKLAAEKMRDNPRWYTFAEDDPEPGGLLAIRWNAFTVLVVRIDGESMPALYSTSHLIACDFPPLKGDPKAEAPAGRGEEQVNQAMIAAMAASLEQNRQLADLRAQLITAHGEAEERMRERDEARSEVERWRAIAEKCGIDAEKNRIRLQAALARKQRVIDDACRVYMSVGRLDPDTAHRMHAAICHEATPTYAESPVGSEQPTRLGSVGNDPLQVEWEADGFRITAMPEEWRGDFIETHEGVSVSSAACPLWCEPDSLWLRGNNRKKDNSLVLVPEADRLRVMAAIASVNAKHRKTTPTIETVAEYLNSGEPGRSESPCYGLIDAVRALHAEVDCRIEHGATSGGHLEYVRCKLADMLRKADIREVDLTSPVGNPPETPDRSAEVPGANPAVTLAFKRSLDEASAIVAEWPAWKRDALKSVRETLESVPDEPVTNPAKVAESDGTKALRLVARLADLCRHRWSDLSPISCDAKAAEDLASEARGGGE
jgi:hypothetical protein